MTKGFKHEVFEQWRRERHKLASPIGEDAASLAIGRARIPNDAAVEVESAAADEDRPAVGGADAAMRQGQIQERHVRA